jgi:orotate phosphoribosyltransferase
MLSYKDSLNVLKKTRALLEGHFVLTSGLHSNRYVQCAKLLSDPSAASKICSSLAEKISKSFSSVDLILSPALGGIIIGYEIGRILNKEAIFSERVEGKFQLRRGFSIKKDTKVLIVEDVITTGKSILECAKLVKKANAVVLGFACIIDRSDKKNLLIKKNKIISQIKISIPVYKKNALPLFLKRIPATKQGSRFLK